MGHPSRRALLALLLGWFVGATGADGETRVDVLDCGTFVGREQIEYALHMALAERRAREGLALAQLGSVERLGDVAVLEGDGVLIAGANPFDLGDSQIVFAPAGQGYSVQRMESVFEGPIGRRLSIGDDANVAIELPFSFRFFGASWNRVYINSDGNLTFDRADSGSASRNVARFLTGPPRVALFFADLDPSEGGSVHVAELADRLVVTWDAVPEWDETNENTFQVVLESNGRVILRYGSVEAPRAVVGLSPGTVSGGVEFADLGSGRASQAGAVVERFLAERTIDNVATVRRFYDHFPDAFEGIVLWTTFESDTGNAFAFETTVQNGVRGIGDNRFNSSRRWGSDGTLESFLFMGNLDGYPDSPQGRILGASGGPTVMALLAHETGHRWLARVQFLKDGALSNDLLGRQNAHWSFFLDSDGSFMEGNQYAVEANNRFRTTGFELAYSSLDLYLMGFVPPSAVAPFFYIEGGSGQDARGNDVTNETQPESGVVVTGTRRNVLLDDVIGAEGFRTPDFQAAPKSFRYAWILLHRPGRPPTAAQLSKLEAFRTAWEPFFQARTRGRAFISTSLEP